MGMPVPAQVAALPPATSAIFPELTKSPNVKILSI